MYPRIVAAAALSVLCMVAHGEDPKSQVTAASRCDKEVREYLQVIQYIRESAGAQISSRVAAGYVDEKSLREVQEKQGSCAAAELIRTKTASRRS